MEGTHVASDEMPDLQFCRCCLSTDAEELCSGNSFRNILNILIKNKLEKAEVPLLMCYRCSHTMRKISKFRDMCLLTDAFLNKFSKELPANRQVEIELFEQEKIRLNIPREPSTSNTLCINVIGRGTPSKINVVSIVKNSKPQKNYTKYVNCITKSTEEKELDLNLSNEPSIITDSMDFRDVYVYNDITDKINVSPEICRKKTLTKEKDPKKKVKLKKEKYCKNHVTLNKEKDSLMKMTLKNEKDPKKKLKLKKEKHSNKKVTIKKEKYSLLNLEPPVISEVEDAVCISLTIEEQIKEKEDRAKEDYFVNSLFKCELCVKVFKAKHVLDGHMEKHKESHGAHKCLVCSQRFGSDKSLRRHGRQHGRHYECPVCAQRCWPRPAFREHVARHRGLTSRCPVCGKCFTGRLTHLRTHVRVAHGTGPRYKCDTCGKVYDDRYLFKLHILRHSGTPQHQCPECPKAFFTARILTLHMKKHAASQEYYCVECDRHFPWHSSFLGHLKTSPAHRDPTLKFECAHCPLHFPSLPRLQTHVRRRHEGAPSPGQCHACERCGRTFNSSSNLLSHTRFRHEGFKLPRKFACTMCDKVFSAKPSLRDHIYTHTGERPFECHVCHYKFTQKSAMNTHIRKMHSADAKPAAKRCSKRVGKGETEKLNE